jgi:hypothetical protein
MFARLRGATVVKPHIGLGFVCWLHEKLYMACCYLGDGVILGADLLATGCQYIPLDWIANGIPATMKNFIVITFAGASVC